MQRKSIVYGFHSAEEALQNHPARVNHVWVSGTHHSARLNHLIQEAKRHKIPVTVVDRAVLTRLAGSTHHQDIVMELSPYTYFSAEELLREVDSNTIFCILDEIQDATNLGTLIRTIEGAGVKGVFIPERRAASVTETTHRLSAGAVEHVKIARVTNVSQLIDRMHQTGIRILCADPSAEKLWYQVDYKGPIAILVGNEYKGVRRLLKEKSDELVGIPMLGKIRSLNVNIATAVLLYEAIRQRGLEDQGTKNYRSSSQE